MILELWRHRIRYPLGCHFWWRAWAKRLWTLPSLVGTAYRLFCLRWRGATLGHPIIISPSDIGGKLRYLKIGGDTFVGRVSIQVHESVIIGSSVCLNDGVSIFTSSHLVDSPEWAQFSKPVRIDDHAWIASRAILLPGVHIGRGAVVGAGCVVSRDVPPGAVAVGSPCRILPDRRPEDLSYSPARFVAGVSAWLSDENLRFAGQAHPST